MPLHLLGKKSWNVYNPENVARVRKDEAAAHAEIEKRERQSRNEEAEARLRLLRADKELIPSQSVEDRELEPYSTHNRSDLSRKRRRLNGEDDTDRDIRLAMMDATAAPREPRVNTLVDTEGHIDLVQEQSCKLKSRHETANANGPVGMRLSDAAGYNSKGEPWYTNRTTTQGSNSATNKDVWGNDDPRRQEREQQRVATNDPLALMKQGVRRLRENEKQRIEWMKQRERDLYEVERLARRSKRRARRRSDEDDLDGFSLDAPEQDQTRSTSNIVATKKDQPHGHRRSRHRHRHHYDRMPLSKENE